MTADAGPTPTSPDSRIAASLLPDGDSPSPSAPGRAHAGQAHPRSAPRRRPVLRTEVGRLPLHRVPGRRRGRVGQPQREAADPVLPRAGRGTRRELPARCVLDGEVVIAGSNGLDFDALSQRIHPASKRVRQLAEATPASFVAFDLLAHDDTSYMETPYAQRRKTLEKLLKKATPPVHLTPATQDPDVAADWFSRFEGAGLDGVVAKPVGPALPAGQAGHAQGQAPADRRLRRRRLPHAQGRRRRGLHAARALRLERHTPPRRRGVGVQRGPPARAGRRGRALPEGALEGHPWAGWAEAQASGAGRPERMNRWNAGKDMTWEPLRPEAVCEVSYDHLQPDRFRHATSFVRWRPDRDPASCTYDAARYARAHGARRRLRDVLHVTRLCRRAVLRTSVFDLAIAPSRNDHGADRSPAVMTPTTTTASSDGFASDTSTSVRLARRWSRRGGPALGRGAVLAGRKGSLAFSPGRSLCLLGGELDRRQAGGQTGRPPRGLDRRGASASRPPAPGAGHVGERLIDLPHLDAASSGRVYLRQGARDRRRRHPESEARWAEAAAELSCRDLGELVRSKRLPSRASDPPRTQDTRSFVSTMLCAP